MAFEIILIRRGKIELRTGTYPTEKAAIPDAQMLADNVMDDVQVGIIPKGKYAEKRTNSKKQAKKTLKDVSKQLAKASKTHAKQSKRVAKVARRLNSPFTGSGWTEERAWLQEARKTKPKKVTSSRARQIISQAQAATKFGPWSDQLVRVMTQGEYRFLYDHWHTMGGSASFLDALLDIANPSPETRLNPSHDWIQGVDREIEARGTEGAFTAQARRAGYSDTMEFARKVMAGWRSGKRTVYNRRTGRQQGITQKTMDRANLALNMQKRRRNAAYPGDYPVDSVLDAGEVYINKIDALMEEYKGTPNYNKLYGRWERAINATARGSVEGAKRAYESALELVGESKRKNSYHGFSVSENQVRKVIDDLHGRTGKTYVSGIINRTGLSKRAVFTILEDRLGYDIEGMGVGKPGFIRRQNPSVGEIGAAIGRGAKKLGGYVVEGTHRAGEEAKRAALYARFKDLEACAARLGIDTDDLMDGKLNASATLNEIADRIEDAEQNLARYGGEVDAKRAARAKRKKNPSSNYFVSYTRPSSGFRYFTDHRLKSAATKAKSRYERDGFANVRIGKNRPKNALPAGLFDMV